MTFDRDEYDYGATWWTTATNDEFAENARRPDEWVNAARPLRVGAYVLKSQSFAADIDRNRGRPAVRASGLLFTSLFLASLSVENVLKAVLLVRRPELADKGRLRFENWGHDLTRIAMEARFDLEADEADFVRVNCNPCIVSFGRYPMAANKTRMAGLYQFHTGAFVHFESIFMRAARTALREGAVGADADRAVEMERVLSDLRNDVPPATLMG